MNIEKVINPGRIRYSEVFLKIKFIDNKLTISGVVGPKSNGDCTGICGQIQDSLDKITAYSEGWDQKLVSDLKDLWGKWHLNDLTAGSPAQQAHLATLNFPGGASHYEWALQELEKAGLQPDQGYQYKDKPYSYGSAWLHTEVPADVLETLSELPVTEKTPAWV